MSIQMQSSDGDALCCTRHLGCWSGLLDSRRTYEVSGTVLMSRISCRCMFSKFWPGNWVLAWKSPSALSKPTSTACSAKAPQPSPRYPLRVLTGQSCFDGVHFVGNRCQQHGLNCTFNKIPVNKPSKLVPLHVDATYFMKIHLCQGA